MNRETMMLNLARAEKVASRAETNVDVHRYLAFKLETLGLNSAHIRETLEILESTHDLCLVDIRRIRVALKALLRS